MSKLPNPKNASILINIDGKLYPRDEAKVSVFDSVVQGGDAVWEGIRIYNGRAFMLEEHLDRMVNSARAMAFSEIPSREYIKEQIFSTLRANDMYDNAHIRLTLTRGRKFTSGMSPHFNQYGPTLIVLAEWKDLVYSSEGIKLITSSVRRNSPQCVDSKIHHNNLINNILAKIEANLAGADDAVMLDVDGFVSETNATNMFFIRDDKLFTPFADSCLPGITRQNIIDLAEENKIEVQEKRISLAEMYMFDEAFVTGSMGGVTPVLEIDGRQLSKEMGPVTHRLKGLYSELATKSGVPIPNE